MATKKKKTTPKSTKAQNTAKAATAIKKANPVKALAVKKSKNTASLSADVLQKLRTYNIWAAVILGVQALAIAVIGTNKAVHITTTYPAVDSLATSVAGEPVLATASRVLFDIRFAWVVAAVLMVFSAVYLLIATIFRKRYEARLQVGMNDFRWLGIGLGSAGLAVATALASGVTGFASLLMLFALVAFGGLAVLAAEELARRESSPKAVLSHVVCAVGFGGFLAAVVVLAVTAGGALLYDGSIAGLLWATYIALFVFFIVGFLLEHYRILRRGWVAGTLKTEKIFMLFTLLLASVPAWLLFAGFLLP